MTENCIIPDELGLGNLIRIDGNRFLNRCKIESVTLQQNWDSDHLWYVSIRCDNDVYEVKFDKESEAWRLIVRIGNALNNG